MTIRQRRKDIGMKQNDLSAASGVKQQLLSMIERGDRGLTVPVARKLAPFLGVKWYELIDGEEESA